jgi:hypothetical protein
MRLLAVLFIGAACVHAAPTITAKGVDAISWTSARIQWQTNVSTTNNYIELSSTSSTRPLAYHGPLKAAGTNHGYSVGGLAPGTTYTYYVCSTSSGETCDTATFSTLAEPTTRFADPTPPTEWAVPTPDSLTYSTTYTVGGSCSDLQLWLTTAAGTSGAGNIEVITPHGATCTANYAAFGRVGTGWIWVHSDGIIPPPGVRITPEWAAQMTIIQNTMDTGLTPMDMASGGTSKWIFSGIKFTYTLSGSNVGQKTITGCTNASPIVCATSTAYGWPTGSVVQVYGALGNTAANGRNKKITVVDSTHFSIDGTTGNGAYTSGGSVIKAPFATSAIMNIANANVTDMVFDRCWFKGADWPAMTPLLVRLQGGSHMAVKNSYLTGGFAWRPVHPDTGLAIAEHGYEQEAIDFSRADGTIMENNFTDVPGITFFAQGNNGTIVIQDVVTRRNEFAWNLATLRTSASWDGYDYIKRQPWEAKNCLRCSIEGNTFTRHFTDGYSTGSLASAIILSPRASDTPGQYDSINVLKDITIKDNLHAGPGFVNVSGQETLDVSTDVEATKRILIENNACAPDGLTWTDPGGIIQGHTLYIGRTLEDIVVRHNSCPQSKGYTGVASWMYWALDRGAGIRIYDNIFPMPSATLFARDSGGASGMLPAIVSSGSGVARWTDLTSRGFDSGGAAIADTSSVLTNNIFVPLVTDHTLTANYASTAVPPTITQAACATVLSGIGSNVCLGLGGSESANTRLGLLKMYSTTDAKNFDLRSDSPGKSGYPATAFCSTNPTLCMRASDGKDVGADMDRLRSRTGHMLNPPKVVPISGSTRLRYVAPDSAACSWEASTVAASGAAPPNSDGGGSRIRDVAVTIGVNTNLRLHCPVESYSCPVAGGSCTLIQ